jgi:cholinesterase
MWNPVVDNDLVPDYTYTLFTTGQFIRVPIITGADSNDGTVFAPKNTSTLAESNRFLRDQWPHLTLAQLGRIDDMYPNPNTSCPSTGCYWRQLANAYGDIRYMCPGVYIASMYVKDNVTQAWNYRFNAEDPTQIAEGLGVPHTTEVNAIWGPSNTGGGAPLSYYPNGTNAQVVPVIQAYWTSFIRTFNPNTHRYPGSVSWEEWTNDAQQRIVFETGGSTNMEAIGAEKASQCSFFFGIGANIKQ